MPIIMYVASNIILKPALHRVCDITLGIGYSITDIKTKTILKTSKSLVWYTT
jgi:hypothetical protein